MHVTPKQRDLAFLKDDQLELMNYDFVAIGKSYRAIKLPKHLLNPDLWLDKCELNIGLLNFQFCDIRKQAASTF